MNACSSLSLSLLFSVALDFWVFIYSVTYNQLQTLFFVKLKLSPVWSVGSTSGWLLCLLVHLCSSPVFTSILHLAQAGFYGSLLVDTSVRIMPNVCVSLGWSDTFAVELSCPGMWTVFQSIQKYFYVF